MNETSKKGLLVVSFGTSYPDTLEKNIAAIESDMADAFPDHKLYRAFTSKMILRKLLKRDQLVIDTVTTALQRMHIDGITEVLIQPTHILNGIENDIMLEDTAKFADHFDSIKIGTPLLTTTSDQLEMVDIIKKEYTSLTDDQLLIFMGHGTSHYTNTVYAALNYMFQNNGCPNIIVGTVEAYPSLEDLFPAVQQQAPKEIILAPLMIVAGDHAKNDMAGDDEDSWKNELAAKGYQVSCKLKGLGEYPAIRQLLVAHAKNAEETFTSSRPKQEQATAHWIPVSETSYAASAK